MAQFTVTAFGQQSIRTSQQNNLYKRISFYANGSVTVMNDDNQPVSKNQEFKLCFTAPADFNPDFLVIGNTYEFKFKYKPAGKINENKFDEYLELDVEDLRNQNFLPKYEKKEFPKRFTSWEDSSNNIYTEKK